MKLKEFASTTKGRIMMAAPAVTTAVFAATPMLSYASDASGSAGADAAEAVTMFSKVTSLFSTYPLNVYIGGGLVVLGLGIFGVAKRVSGSRG